MIKKKFALSSTLIFVPIAALAQETNPGNAEKPLPPVTVLSDEKAEPIKHKVTKKKSAPKKAKSTATSASSQPPSGVDLSLGDANGPRSDSQGVMPPSVTAQTVGGIIVSDPTLGRVSSVSREGLNLLGGGAQTNFYQAADIIPSVSFESPDPFGLSNTRNINIAGKGDFHLSRNINGLPIMGIVGGNDLYDLENISRLDVYRGVIPADRSLGVSNASGVIDQIILGPQDTASNFFEQSFGSWNFNKTFARIDTGLLSTGTQLFISGSTTSADKWTGAGDESRDNFALGLSQKVNKDLKVDINAVYSKFDGNPYKALTYQQTLNLSQNYGRDYDQTFDKNNPANYYKFNRVSSEDFAVFANVDYRLAEGQHIVFKPYYWNNDGEQWSGVGTGPTGQVQIWRQQNDNLGGVLEYNGHFATGTDVAAGYWWQSLAPPPPPTDQRRFNISSTGELDFAKWNTIAKIDNFIVNSPYIQLTQTLGTVTVTGGVRYMSLGAPNMHYYNTAGVPDGTLDQALASNPAEYADAFVTARDYNEFLPNFGITKDLGGGWSTNFAYGRNFGRPDWGPQASNYISNRAAFQGKDIDLQDLVDNVRPEVADQFSAQVRYSDYGFTIVPTLFYAKHENQQVKINDPALNNLAYYVGTGSSTEYGAELQASYQFGSQLFAFASATLASQTFDGDTQTLSKGGAPISTKGNQIPNTPQAMFKAGVTYTWYDFSLTPVVRVIGSRYGDAENRNKVSGYTVVDFTAAYNISNKFGLQEATLKFGVVNLFDKEYISQISPNDTDLSSDAQYYVSAPRTFIGTVAVKF